MDRVKNDERAVIVHWALLAIVFYYTRDARSCEQNKLFTKHRLESKRVHMLTMRS